MSLGRRFGVFFALLAIGLFILFVFSDIAGASQLDLLIWGAVAMIISGLLLVSFPKPPPPPSTRFRLLRQRKRQEPKK